MTALAIMAMASIGIEPQTFSTAGRSMAKALDFVLQKKHQDAQGYLGGRDGSRMYGHGITTLMLTEMLGMGATVEQNKQIHEMLVNAIKLILSGSKSRKVRKTKRWMAVHTNQPRFRPLRIGLATHGTAFRQE